MSSDEGLGTASRQQPLRNYHDLWLTFSTTLDKSSHTPSSSTTSATTTITTGVPEASSSSSSSIVSAGIAVNTVDIDVLDGGVDKSDINAEIEASSSPDSSEVTVSSDDNDREGFAVTSLKVKQIRLISTANMNNTGSHSVDHKNNDDDNSSSSSRDHDSDGSSHMCGILGAPSFLIHDQSRKALRDYFAAYKMFIRNITIVYDDSDSNVFVCEFDNLDVMSSFLGVYNNLHFDGSKKASLVFPIKTIYFKTVENANADIHSALTGSIDRSCSSLSKNVFKCQNIRSIAELGDFSSSASSPAAAVDADITDIDAASLGLVLPHCPACIRRIKTSFTGFSDSINNSMYSCSDYLFYNLGRSSGSDAQDSEGVDGESPNCDSSDIISDCDPVVIKDDCVAASSSGGGAADGSSNSSSNRNTNTSVYETSVDDCTVCAIIRSYQSHQSNDNSSYKDPVISIAKPWTSKRSISKHFSGCFNCGLKENAWICMICGHCGCGRYTRQHAEMHFNETKHPVAIELATLRIWDYITDSFVHNEDTTYAEAHPGGVVYSTTSTTSTTSSSSSVSTLASAAGSPRSLSANSIHGGSYGGNSPLDIKGDIHSKLLMSSGSKSIGGSSNSSGNRFDRNYSHGFNSIMASKSNNSEFDVYASKFDALTSYYENLLSEQLQVQSLHFEKLLNRESIRLLEEGFRTSSSSSLTSSGDSKLVRRGETLINIELANSRGLGSIQLRTLSGDESASGGGGGVAGEMHSDSFVSDEEMGRLEALKLQISSLESLNQRKMDEIRSLENDIRDVKKSNEYIIREQKKKKDAIAALQFQEAEINRKSKEKCDELREELVDIAAHVRTQKRVLKSSSHIQEELQNSYMLITGGVAPPTNGKNIKRGGGRK